MMIIWNNIYFCIYIRFVLTSNLKVSFEVELEVGFQNICMDWIVYNACNKNCKK